MKKALLTLVVGDKYSRNFERYCERLWTDYARRNGFDVIIIDGLLDTSQRAVSRSPAWQKCLVLSHPKVCDYDQVVWIDADVLINPNSPDIVRGVPTKMIGAVDEYATPNQEERRLYFERLYEHHSRRGAQYLNDLSASDYHGNFGLKGEFHSVVQTGVMVLSPKHHRELLEHVYYTYEDKGSARWHYEMRPLSYEIQRNDYVFWIDPKFNMIWPFVKQLHYPFLFFRKEPLLKKRLRKLGLNLEKSLHTKCATAAFLNNYFLHFAGCADEMRFVNPSITSVLDM